MHVYGPNDITLEWDPESPEGAKARWLELKARGYELYRVDGSQLKRFDPSVGKAIAVPAVPPPSVVSLWPTRVNPTREHDRRKR